ncbi:hypothetical protein CR513_46806, partial [Mucuna pruriens]
MSSAKFENSALSVSSCIYSATNSSITLIPKSEGSLVGCLIASNMLNCTRLLPNSIESVSTCTSIFVLAVTKNGRPKIKIDVGMTFIEAIRSNMASKKSSLLRHWRVKVRLRLDIDWFRRLLQCSCLSPTASSSPLKMVSCLVMALSVVAIVGMVVLSILDSPNSYFDPKAHLERIQIFKLDIALESNSAGIVAFQIVNYHMDDYDTTAFRIGIHLLVQHSQDGLTRLSFASTSFSIRDGVAPLIPNYCVLLAIFEISVSPECCLIPQISFLMVAVLDAGKNFSNIMRFISPQVLKRTSCRYSQSLAAPSRENGKLLHLNVVFWYPLRPHYGTNHILDAPRLVHHIRRGQLLEHSVIVLHWFRLLRLTYNKVKTRVNVRAIVLREIKTGYVNSWIPLFTTIAMEEQRWLTKDVVVCQIAAFMTRKMSFGSFHPFDLEIKKTLNRIKKSKNMHIGHNSSSSVNSIIEIEDFEMKPDFADNPLYEPDPMENDNNRTLKELATPDLEPFQIYELKSKLIHLLPKFHGLAGEDSHKHLKEFHLVCSMMRSQGILEDYIKMKAFPFSLDGVAKD